MKHFILLYWVISFSIGFTTLISIVLVYFRFQNKSLGYYILFMICLSILVITSGLKQYHDINLPMISKNLLNTLDIISLLAEGFLPALVCMFALSFIEFRYKKHIIIIYSLLSFLIFLLLFSSYIFFFNYFIYCNILFIIVLLSAVFISTSLIFVFFNQIKTRIIRSYFFTLTVMGAVFICLFLLDLFFSFKTKTTRITSSFRVGVILYLCWNLITIIYFIKFFFNRDSKLAREHFQVFFKHFNISEREKEVIQLIIEGWNNVQIADKLFISSGTVKRHIHNIFDKTGAKSRMHLAHLIKNS